MLINLFLLLNLATFNWLQPTPPSKKKPVEANLLSLEDSARNHTQRYEGILGGSDLVKRKPVVHHQLLCKAGYLHNKNVLRVNVTDTLGYLEGTVQVLGLPGDWSNYQALSLDVRNLSARPVELALLVIGSRNQLEKKQRINKQATIRLDLADLPLTAGVQPPYQPVAVRIVCKTAIKATDLILSSLVLVPSKTPISKPVVDKFGQRKNTDWPGKIKNELSLKQQISSELKFLDALPALQPRDAYGGFHTAQPFKHNGYFKVDKDSMGHWWFVTPLGNPFWSLGVNGVRPKTATLTDVTRVKGREFLFESLPNRDGPYAACYNGDFVSFFYWNILRKWGSIEAWRDRVIYRFSKWGINTVGNWSDELFLAQRQIPHTRTLRTNLSSKLRFGHGFADVFDPAWEKHLDSLFAQQVAPYRNDQMLIGYFVDNEQRWKAMHLFDTKPKAVLRKHWVQYLQSLYPTLPQLNQAWQTNFATWHDLEQITQHNVPDQSQCQKDIAGFELLFATQYFSTISKLLKKHGPNHLYLGCRFLRNSFVEPIVAIAGQFCDVITVNAYVLYPQPNEFDKWHKASAKPLMIGEFHFPLNSERQLSPIYQNFTASQRAFNYRRYVEELASLPYAIGCHWYQHVDQNITGRGADGENQTVGLVDITDQPYTDLVESVNLSAKHLFEWHNKSKK